VVQFICVQYLCGSSVSAWCDVIRFSWFVYSTDMVLVCLHLANYDHVSTVHKLELIMSQKPWRWPT